MDSMRPRTYVCVNMIRLGRGTNDEESHFRGELLFSPRLHSWLSARRTICHGAPLNASHIISDLFFFGNQLYVTLLNSPVYPLFAVGTLPYT